MIAAIRYLVTLAVGITIGYWIAGEWNQPVPANIAESLRVPHNDPVAAPVELAERPEPRTLSAPNTPSTLAGILQIPGDYAQSGALYNLAADASREEIERLLDEAAGIVQLSERRAATSILYGRFAEIDPVAAIDHILAYGGVFADNYLRATFHTWSRLDLNAAVAAAITLDNRLKQVAGGAILMARDDLPSQERWDVARQLGLEPMMARIESQSQMAMVDSDPYGAWAAAVASEDPQIRMNRLFTIGQMWARTDPVAAMDAAGSIDNLDMRMSLLQQIVQQWSQADPHAALARVLEEPPSQRRANLIAEALSAIERVEALDIIDTLDPQERNESLTRVLSKWAQEDPRAAAEWMQTREEDRDARFTYIVATPFAARHPEEAFAWALALGNEDASAAVQMVMRQVGQTEPDLAIRLAAQISDFDLRITATNSFLESWAQTEPRAAADYLFNLDAGGQRGELYASVLRVWSEYDRDSAVNYLDRISSLAERDVAIMSLMNHTMGDPQFAESLYARISTTEQRQPAAQQLFYVLQQRDPARAELYREAAGFVEE